VRVFADKFLGRCLGGPQSDGHRTLILAVTPSGQFCDDRQRSIQEEKLNGDFLEVDCGESFSICGRTSKLMCPVLFRVQLHDRDAELGQA